MFISISNTFSLFPNFSKPFKLFPVAAEISLIVKSFSRKSLNFSDYYPSAYFQVSFHGSFFFLVFSLDYPNLRIEVLVVPSTGGMGRFQTSNLFWTLLGVYKLPIYIFFLLPLLSLFPVRRIGLAERFVTVYEKCLRCGLRFPLHHVYENLQQELSIALGQMNPNVVRQVTDL